MKVLWHYLLEFSPDREKLFFEALMYRRTTCIQKSLGFDAVKRFEVLIERPLPE